MHKNKDIYLHLIYTILLNILHIVFICLVEIVCVYIVCTIFIEFESFEYKNEIASLRLEIAINKRTIKSLKEILNSKKKLRMVATAYCNDKRCINVEKWRDGKTKIGTIARYGIVAVDPKIIPLKSVIYIDGLGLFKAEDIGSKIKGHRIDIFLGNYNEAIKFGRKQVNVTIYDKNN